MCYYEGARHWYGWYYNSKTLEGSHRANLKSLLYFFDYLLILGGQGRAKGCGEIEDPREIYSSFKEKGVEACDKEKKDQREWPSIQMFHWGGTSLDPTSMSTSLYVATL